MLRQNSVLVRIFKDVCCVDCLQLDNADRYGQGLLSDRVVRNVVN